MKRRHVLAVLGLSFITLGIYVIYWLYKTRKELLHFLPDKKAIPRVIVLFVPYFVMIGLVICTSIIVASLDFDSPAYGAVNALTIILIILSTLAIFVVSFWWFYRYFKAVEAVTQGNDAMLYYTLWIILTLMGLGPVWVLIVQNDLNKFIENGHQPLKAVGYAGGQQQWQQAPPQPQYGQPYPPAPPYPYQAPPAPSQQQPYSPYPPQTAPEHHDQHHASHGQHNPHHGHNQHGHHGHPDQPHNDQTQYQPPEERQG